MTAPCMACKLAPSVRSNTALSIAFPCAATGVSGGTEIAGFALGKCPLRRRTAKAALKNGNILSRLQPFGNTPAAFSLRYWNIYIFWVPRFAHKPRMLSFEPVLDETDAKLVPGSRCKTITCCAGSWPRFPPPDGANFGSLRLHFSSDFGTTNRANNGQ